jgi:hypothetical protein
MTDAWTPPKRTAFLIQMDVFAAMSALALGVVQLAAPSRHGPAVGAADETHRDQLV